MFKIIGYIFIIFSSFYMFNYRLIKDYKTGLFIEETVRLLQLLKIECTAGRTYPEAITKFRGKYYKNFNFLQAAEFFSHININSPVKREVCGFFSRLGKRDKNSELEYIENNISYFQYKADILKDNYNRNSKPCFIAGISVGLIVVIVLL